MKKMEFTPQEREKARKELYSAVQDAQETSLRILSPYFGLRETPEELRIEIGGRSALCRDPQTTEWFITIGQHHPFLIYAFELTRDHGVNAWNECLAMKARDTAHEVGHYLHLLTNPVSFGLTGWYDWRENQEGIREGHLLEETIAEVAAIEYTHRVGILGRTSFVASMNEFFWPAWALWKDRGPEVLKELVRDVGNALKIVRPYAREVKNPARPPEELMDAYLHISEAA